MNSQIYNNLRSQITNLKADSKVYWLEMVARGKQLVKLAQLIKGYKGQMTPEAHERLMEIITEFEVENTKTIDQPRRQKHETGIDRRIKSNERR
ncbi:MAG: hypothetical protein MIO92_05515 [Methanosarcinaceae archaeon]|nr:hypothetical protein [Methanosarcinaceae archaeon]